MDNKDMGPDIVIAGAARSGTSYLASILGEHPVIDPGAVKEPNYFSREFHRGAGWYDGLYEPRQTGLLRMDASMSYTFPQFPEALERLALASPSAVVVYAVREPLARALSHYQLNRDYFRREGHDFGAALRANPVYAGAGDYQRWLSEIASRFPASRTIIVPFTLVTTEGGAVAAAVCRLAGIDALAPGVLRDDLHRNDVVAMRSTAILRARQLIVRAGAYPLLRRTLGADRLRKARSLLTRPVVRETLEQALSTCSTTQLRELEQLYVSAQAAVVRALDVQDHALGLNWSAVWSKEVPAGGSPATAALERSADGGH